MDNAPRLVPAEQLTNYLQNTKPIRDPRLQQYREALSALPKDGPAFIFLQAYLVRLEALGRGESSQLQHEELERLSEILRSGGVFQRKPDTAKFQGIIGDAMVKSGFSYQETNLAVTEAAKKKLGASLAPTALAALSLKVVGKTLCQIADTLCDRQMHTREKPPHRHKHKDQCYERFRKEIQSLTKDYEKYKPRN